MAADQVASKGFKMVENVLVGDDPRITEDEPLNVGELILRVFEANPETIGQIDGLTGSRDSFAAMKDRTVRLAIWLRKQGVQPGDMVGLCADNHPDGIIPFLASLCIGAVCATWDHVLLPVPSRYYLGLVGPKIVFLQQQSAAVLEAAAEELNLDLKTVVFEECPGRLSFKDVLAEATAEQVSEFSCHRFEEAKTAAALVASSGTSGLPKGTVVSHQTLRYSTSDSPAKIGTVVMWSPTLRWQYGMLLALEAIRSQLSRVLVPDYDDARAYCEFIDKYQVQWFSSDPFLLIRCLKYGIFDKYPLASLKEISVTGAHFKRDAQQACANALPHVDVLQAYGMTDAGGRISKQRRGYKPGSCGFIVPGCQLKIVHRKTGQTLGPNQVGEIYVKSNTAINEYYKNPEATKRAFDPEGWLLTGDIGYYDQDGELFLHDRVSEFINYRSINVLPAEIEVVLDNHPSVYKSVVIGVPHEIDDEQPMAIVTKIPGKQVTAEELIDLVSKELPYYCQLHAGVKFVEKLPQTATGKIARAEVKKMVKLFGQ